MESRVSRRQVKKRDRDSSILRPPLLPKFGPLFRRQERPEPGRRGKRHKQLHIHTHRVTSHARHVSHMDPRDRRVINDSRRRDRRLQPHLSLHPLLHYASFEPVTRSLLIPRRKGIRFPTLVSPSVWQSTSTACDFRHFPAIRSVLRVSKEGKRGSGRRGSGKKEQRNT